MPQPPSPPRFLRHRPNTVRRTAVAIAAAGLAVLGVLASGATLEADRVARGMLADLAADIQCDARFDGLELHLTSGIAARRVQLSATDRQRLQVEVDRVETDLGLVDLLLGARVPSEVHLVRPRLHLGDAPTALLEERGASFTPPSSSAPHAGFTSPRSLTIEDGEVRLRGPLGASGPESLTVTALQARLTWSVDGWVIEGRGQIPWDEEERLVTVTAMSTPEPSVHLRFDRPAGVIIPWEGRQVHLSFEALHLEGDGQIAVERFTFVEGSTRVSAERGMLRGVDMDRPTDLASLEALILEDASFVLPSVSLSARQALIAPDATGSTSITLTDPLLGWTEWGVSGQATELRATLEASVPALFRGVSPISHLAALALDTPRVDIPLSLLDTSIDALATVTKSPPTPTLHGLTTTPVPPRIRRLVEALGGVDLGWHQGTVQLLDEEGAPSLRLQDTRLRHQARSDRGSDVALSATLWREGRRSGGVEMEVTVDAEGRPLTSRGHINGSDVAHVLSRFSDYLTVEPDALLDVHYDYHHDPGAGPIHHLKGTVAVDRFGFQAWRVSHVPVTGLEGQASFALSYDAARRHAHLHMDTVRIGGLQLEADLNVAHREDRPPRVDAWVRMPVQDCGAAARAIPEAMLPRLEGLSLEGQLGFTASLSVDLAASDELELAVIGDTSRCHVLSLGPHVDLDALASGLLVHHPVEPRAGIRRDIAVGPGTAEWVPSHLIPAFVKAGARVTEDRAFLHHGGVRWDLVARALKLNLKRGRFVYGGSTITQQLVKNLFLTREKTLSRKIEELIIAWEIERRFSKDEILTHYLNIIEYGPDIYGLRHAARHYFAKEPRHLTALEAAFMMGLKPYPKKGHEQWRRQRLNAWWVKRVSGVMDAMRRRERAITDVTFLAAAPFQPTFRRPNQSMYTRTSTEASAPDPSGVEQWVALDTERLD